MQRHQYDSGEHNRPWLRQCGWRRHPDRNRVQRRPFVADRIRAGVCPWNSGVWKPAVVVNAAVQHRRRGWGIRQCRSQATRATTAREQIPTSAPRPRRRRRPGRWGAGGYALFEGSELFDSMFIVPHAIGDIVRPGPATSDCPVRARNASSAAAFPVLQTLLTAVQPESRRLRAPAWSPSVGTPSRATIRPRWARAAASCRSMGKAT